METKICTKCLNTKLVSQFTAARRQRDGLQPNCKPCTAAYTRQWRKKNKHRLTLYEQKYAEKNQTKMIKYRFEHYWLNDPDLIRFALFFNKLKKEIKNVEEK